MCFFTIKVMVLRDRKVYFSMVFWLTGNVDSGKSTLSKKLQDSKTIILDGDNLRKVWTDLTMSSTDRVENCLRIARLASVLSDQGFNVVIAVICPYEKLRMLVRDICHCMFIYLPDGKATSEEFPYEVPEDPDFIYHKRGEQ